MHLWGHKWSQFLWLKCRICSTTKKGCSHETKWLLHIYLSFFSNCTWKCMLLTSKLCLIWVAFNCFYCSIGIFTSCCWSNISNLGIFLFCLDLLWLLLLLLGKDPICSSSLCNKLHQVGPPKKQHIKSCLQRENPITNLSGSIVLIWRADVPLLLTWTPPHIVPWLRSLQNHAFWF